MPVKILYNAIMQLYQPYRKWSILDRNKYNVVLSDIFFEVSIIFC